MGITSDVSYLMIFFSHFSGVGIIDCVLERKVYFLCTFSVFCSDHSALGSLILFMHICF